MGSAGLLQRAEEEAATDRRLPFQPQAVAVPRMAQGVVGWNARVQAMRHAQTEWDVEWAWGAK